MEKTHVITFASPKVGDLDFAEYLNSHSFGSWVRIENTADIVPRLPKNSMEWTYGVVGYISSFTNSEGTAADWHSMNTYLEGIG